jgi:hypothetical protein
MAEGAMGKHDYQISTEVLKALGRYVLQVQADLKELDSDFQQRFADAHWPDNLEIIEEYTLNRFDVCARYLLPTAVSPEPNPINPGFSRHLDSVERGAATKEHGESRYFFDRAELFPLSFTRI